MCYRPTGYIIENSSKTSSKRYRWSVCKKRDILFVKDQPFPLACPVLLMLSVSSTLAIWPAVLASNVSISPDLTHYSATIFRFLSCAQLLMRTNSLLQNWVSVFLQSSMLQWFYLVLITHFTQLSLLQLFFRMFCHVLYKDISLFNLVFGFEMG